MINIDEAKTNIVIQFHIHLHSMILFKNKCNLSSPLKMAIKQFFYLFVYYIHVLSEIVLYR
jgi:hypothetical protein